tara:strand:- start:3851 stop:4975 length:1125 start_codon:yes stop_codon:yes gene_type:complete
MSQAIIVDYCRSPFTPAGRGELVKIRPDDLTASVVKALIERTGIAASDVEDFKLGCAFPEGEQGLNLARLVWFIADLPHCTAATTLNRFCGSSMQIIHDAVGAIASNSGEVFICGGIESMSRVPMTGFNPAPNSALYERFPDAYEGMGITAENVAKKYKISRKEQDEFAAISQQKAAKAQADGKFTDEIIPYGDVTQDGCIRAGTTAESLGGLNPAFDKNGTVTAGTSSPLTDGASAVLVTSEAYADKHNLPKLARIKSCAVVGCDPSIMGIGPVAATQKALERAGLTIDDIDIIELNEAFSSQSLACIKDLKLDVSKINLDGGAVALGHPLGATGARITGKAASLLKREGKKYALATQCIGGGQGIATILEAI